LRNPRCLDPIVPSPELPGEPSPRHLPPRLDPRLGRAGTRSAAAASRPTPPRSGTSASRAAQLTRIVATVMTVAILCASGWGWHLGEVADASVNRTDAIPTDGNEGWGRQGEAMNLLLVGNDSRASATEEELDQL